MNIHWCRNYLRNILRIISAEQSLGKTCRLQFKGVKLRQELGNQRVFVAPWLNILCLDRIYLWLHWIFSSWPIILCLGWIFCALKEYFCALTEYFVPWEIILTDPPRSISSQSHPTWVFLPWAFLKVEQFSKFRIWQKQPNCPAIMVEMLLFEIGAFWQITTPMALNSLALWTQTCQHVRFCEDQTPPFWYQVKSHQVECFRKIYI